MKFCKSLWKLFYKPEIIKILKRNDTGQLQGEIMIMMHFIFCRVFVMLKNGRNAKMTFCFFIGHGRQKLFWGIFKFIMGVPPSNVVTFLLTSLRKGYFLRRRLRCCRFKWQNCSVDGFIFGCKLLAEFQCGIDKCMLDGYNICSRIWRFFNETSPLRKRQRHFESICGRQWINAVFNSHSNFSLL